MKEQESENFLKAYDEYSNDLFRHCYFRIFDRSLAKDLAQEAFCKTWVYIADGKKIDNVRAFLYKVANNLIVDEIRKKKSLSLEGLMEEGFSPKDETTPDMEQTITGQEVIKTLELLEEPYRTAVTMRFVDDLSPTEIARILDISESNVSVRIHRGVKQLRQIVKKNPNENE